MFEDEDQDIDNEPCEPTEPTSPRSTQEFEEQDDHPHHNLLTNLFAPKFTPDLPLLKSTQSINSEIDSIYKSCLADIGKTTTTKLNKAKKTYESLEISMGLDGLIIKNAKKFGINDFLFMGDFAQYLRLNPNDKDMIEKATYALQFMATKQSLGALGSDSAGYTFRNFARKAVFLADYIPNEMKQNFLYIFGNNSNNFNVFWNPNYNATTQLKEGIINTDFIYNNLDTMVALVRWFPTPDEQYRYMLTLQRYISRFVATYTNGTSDGAKQDGCGYHHWNNYEKYMYTFKTVVAAMGKLGTSSFQIKPEAYIKLRDSIMHKMWVSSDQDLVPMSLTGRTGDWDNNEFPRNYLKQLAILGGKILGLETADPVLSGTYNRKYGIEKLFNYNGISKDEGFYQCNFANAGSFRKGNYLIVAKGFNNQLWGAEIYKKENRFGRNQSYGALTILNPGNKSKNGFDNRKWDWNFNPGTTTKVMPWVKLIAAKNRIDELTKKSLAGSLAFEAQDTPYLKGLIGNYGMFAMDFQEREKQGFDGVVFPDTHDETFTFKKSVFFFDDIILCLGSDISHKKKNFPAVTTLFQNCTEPDSFLVNDTTCENTEVTNEIVLTNNNWIIDNFKNGFYVVAGTGSLKFRRSKQSTPSPTQTNPEVLNPPAEASIAFIDHGVNPKNLGYEYLVFPQTDRQTMVNFHYDFYHDKKPYEVINKSSASHTVLHKKTGIYAAALFASGQNIQGNLVIAFNSYPCLVMFQQNAEILKLSLSNPDLGLSGTRDLKPCPEKKIEIKLRGKWKLKQPNEKVQFISEDESLTTFSFTTCFGLPISVEFETSKYPLQVQHAYYLNTEMNLMPIQDEPSCLESLSLEVNAVIHRFARMFDRFFQ